jgi:ubiquinone/menaquinone biosynthesis C-methylase UbiE
MAFEELKQRHAVMWGAAPFERIAGTLADMHESIVRAVRGEPGKRWLDVGCGTGELAFMAAATGAEVTGSDLSPTLVETARRQADERAVDATFEVADVEALPYDEASFDIVTSSVGAIFAPDHATVAAELARVCRPGGELALTAWTSGGSVDEFFRIIGSYAPSPPPGAGVAATWGEPGYAEGLLADHFDVRTTEHNTPWVKETAEEMWTEMSEAFGPIKTLLGALPPDRAESFKSEMLDFFAGELSETGISFDRPYLLVYGVRTG